MRAPKRKRPLPRSVYVEGDTSLPKVADKARYTGSPEHKGRPGYAGPPALRADASRCPDDLSGGSANLPTRWLRSAIRAGLVGGIWENGFPRYVWYRDAKRELVFEARLSNSGLGEYKGYPLGDDEVPSGLMERLS